jgi:cyanophycinase
LPARQGTDISPAVLKEPKGTLILLGGNVTSSGEALATFARLSDAKSGAAIVGVTTASSDVSGSRDHWLVDFAAAGFTNCDIPLIHDREQACDKELAKRFRGARGIFLGGGDQVKLVSVLSGTPVGAAIREAYMEGAVVCGTSAGAAALTKTTLAGNEVDDEGKLVEQYIGPGLGLLGHHAIVDTHFSQRRRLYRLFVVIAEYPELMGLGIDEDTALVVKGDTGTVFGAGGVTFVDASGVKFNNAEEVERGRQLTISALRVGIVGTGYEFDLRKRELAALLPKP